MYAVIKTGGKQERVEEGQQVAVERLGAAEGDVVTFAPLMLVDGETVLVGAGLLSGRQRLGPGGRRDEGAQDQGLHLQAEDPQP